MGFSCSISVVNMFLISQTFFVQTFFFVFSSFHFCKSRDAYNRQETNCPFETPALLVMCSSFSQKTDSSPCPLASTVSRSFQSQIDTFLYVYSRSPKLTTPRSNVQRCKELISSTCKTYTVLLINSAVPKSVSLHYYNESIPIYKENNIVVLGAYKNISPNRFLTPSVQLLPYNVLTYKHDLLYYNNWKHKAKRQI